MRPRRSAFLASKNPAPRTLRPLTRSECAPPTIAGALRFARRAHQGGCAVKLADREGSCRLAHGKQGRSTNRSSKLNHLAIGSSSAFFVRHVSSWCRGVKGGSRRVVRPQRLVYLFTSLGLKLGAAALRAVLGTYRGPSPVKSSGSRACRSRRSDPEARRAKRSSNPVEASAARIPEVAR